MDSILGEADEELPEVADHQVRVSRVGEVAALVELGIADDVGGPLGEGADGAEVPGEDRDRRRYLVRRLPVAGSAAGVLVVVPGAGAGGTGEPVDAHVSQVAVHIEVVGVVTPARPQLGVPRQLAGWGVGQPEAERLRPRLLNPLVARLLLELRGRAGQAGPVRVRKAGHL